MKGRVTKRSVAALKPKVRDGNVRADFLWDTDVTGFGCKVGRGGKKVYVLQYRTRDQRSNQAPKRITLGNHGDLTPAQARSLAAELLLRVMAGEDPREDWATDGDQPTLQDLAKRFLEEYLPNKKRPPKESSLEGYEVLFRLHILPGLGPDTPVDDVTTDDVERFHQNAKGTPYQANRSLSVLRQAFNQAQRWGWRREGSNPVLHIEKYPEKRRGAHKEVMLSPEQMKDLLEAIDVEEEEGTNPTACAVIRVVFWTGWRIREVLRLQWKHLDFQNGRAKLVGTKTSDEEYRSLPNEAIRILKSLPRIKGCDHVFPSRNGKGHLTTVRRPWVRIRKRAGLDDLDGLGALRLHDLRHNVVSWDVSRGVGLEIAGRNVGHKSTQATEVYAHFAPDALKRAADDRADAMKSALDEA